MNKGDSHTLSRVLALRRKLERERSFLEASLDAAVLADHEGVILLANKLFSQLTGHTRRHLYGAPIGRFFLETTEAESLFRSCLENQADQLARFTILTNASEATEVKIRITPVMFGHEGGNGAVITIRDISGVRLAEERKSHLAAIVTSSSDAIIGQSADGIVRVWNASAEKIFGYSASEAVGQPASLILPPELIEEEQDIIERIWRGEQIDRYEALRKRKDGRIINVSVAPAAIRDPEGNITGISRIEREITEQKKFEKELLEARRTAEREKTLAEEAMRAKQLFLSSMSHEIRTPLNAIIGFTKLLLKARLEDTHKEYLHAIRISGEALLALVNDILDLGQAEQAKISFGKTAFRPVAVVRSVLRTFETAIFKRKLELVTHFDQGLPEVLKGDPDRLQQVLMNLVSNAVKFTPQGKISVECRLVKESAGNVTLKFVVTDTGIGIPGSELNHIFDNFRQAGGSAARLYGGTGIGLAIVKHLVSAQGGTVSVQSKRGQGSEFSFTLDFERTRDVPAADAADAPAEPAKGGHRVLVVEDVTLNQIFMKTLLNSFGCEVRIARNGQVAIDMLRKEKFDLVLMDLQMPEMDGYEATQAIRQELRLSVPVIALTADVTSADVERCRKVGMNDYLSKPVDDKLLQAKIMKYCEGAGGWKPASDPQETPAKRSLTNLEYLRRHTYDDHERMKQLLKAYLIEIPRLINGMKQAINNMDWDELRDNAHSLLPSFELVGLNPEYEEMARRIKEHASRKEESYVINGLVATLEDVCIEVVRELESELRKL
jgi:PAS domain S-box-containing protein